MKTHYYTMFYEHILEAICHENVGDFREIPLKPKMCLLICFLEIAKIKKKWTIQNWRDGKTTKKEFIIKI